MKHILLTITILILLCSPAWVGAATYNWYFDADAADDTGAGTEGDPWKTLAKAQTQIDAADSGDIANLYFDRSDTWAVSTGQSNVFIVDATDPIVNINAYGAGDRPIFDGEITDFSAVDASGTNGYAFYRTLFWFQRDSCSIKNIEIAMIKNISNFLEACSSEKLGHTFWAVCR